jgi:beta-phosphoglucomutase-like phosphatase (HAD superfamily)
VRFKQESLVRNNCARLILSALSAAGVVLILLQRFAGSTIDRQQRTAPHAAQASAAIAAAAVGQPQQQIDSPRWQQQLDQLRQQVQALQAAQAVQAVETVRAVEAVLEALQTQDNTFDTGSQSSDNYSAAAAGANAAEGAVPAGILDGDDDTPGSSLLDESPEQLSAPTRCL